jgi:hypothetical protein
VPIGLFFKRNIITDGGDHMDQKDFFSAVKTVHIRSFPNYLDRIIMTRAYDVETTYQSVFNGMADIGSQLLFSKIPAIERIEECRRKTIKCCANPLKLQFFNRVSLRIDDGGSGKGEKYTKVDEEVDGAVDRFASTLGASKSSVYALSLMMGALALRSETLYHPRWRSVMAHNLKEVKAYIENIAETFEEIVKMKDEDETDGRIWRPEDI